MSVDLESRTRAALRQFDSNMTGIFDRAAFYDADVYSQAAYPKLTRAQQFFKYALLAVNVLFFIFGCVLIAVGSYAVTNSIGQLSGSTLPTGVTVLGVFILLLSLLGAVAAWKEVRYMLMIYFAVLLLITLILFFVGIAVYVERNSVDTYITQGWNAAAPDLKNNLETIFGCCGLQMYAPYNKSLNSPYQCPMQPLPVQQGCLAVFDSYLASYYVTAGGSAIAFAVFMFLGMFVVCFLLEGIKKKRAEQDVAKLRASNNAEDDDLRPGNQIDDDLDESEEDDDEDED